MSFRQYKLSAPFAGPFKVVSVHKDDVTVIHLSSNEQFVVKNDTLKPFFGTLEEAARVAQLDYNHHIVSEIVTYAGDPLVRTTLEFEVHYADGDWEWRKYSADIASTEAFKTFINTKPELYLLKYQTTQNRMSKELKRMQSTVIDNVVPGNVCYVHLRAFGARWYCLELDLPNVDRVDYLVECFYGEWIDSNHTKIMLVCPMLEHEVVWTYHDVYSYGSTFKFPANATKITRVLITKYKGLQSFVKGGKTRITSHKRIVNA